MASLIGKTFAVAAVLAVGIPQAAQAAGIWEVERKAGGSCAMSAVYQSSDQADPVLISFVLPPKSRDLGFVAASGGWAELEQREGVAADLMLRFDGKVRYTEWLSQSAPFRRLSGENRAIAGQWGAELGDSLGEALTQSSHLTLVVGETDLGQYDLDDARASFAELRRCSDRG